MRSHLRGLLDELQIYDEALKAGDIRHLFEHPGIVARQREAVTSATSFQFDPGHPWRPPFGVERVGLTPVIVQFGSDTRPAPEHWLAAYREGKEVEQKALDVSGNSPFTARVTFATSPAPEELALRLQLRLERLNAMREAGARLMGRDRLGRDVFARGALQAARWVVGQPPGIYGMEDVLGMY